MPSLPQRLSRPLAQCIRTCVAKKPWQHTTAGSFAPPRWRTLTSGIAKSDDRRSLLLAFQKTLETRYDDTTPFEHLTQIENDNPSPTLVTVVGYLGDRSDLSKSISFVKLKDAARNEEIQVISSSQGPGEHASLFHERLKSARANAPVYLRGQLRPKIEKKKRDERPSGDPPSCSRNHLELSISEIGGELQILNGVPAGQVLQDDTVIPPEKRHLQIIQDRGLRSALALRSSIKLQASTFLQKHRFPDIETPLLFKSTSEGAREFIVPTRRRGHAYALPQSPQQFKQILMASGIPRYSQFAKCFRDEDLRSDRQPEFTQLDLEMAFDDGSQVQCLVEDLIVYLWNTCLGIDLGATSHSSVWTTGKTSSSDEDSSANQAKRLFPRLSYQEAMARFGSDKPDLRIPIPPFQSIGYLLPADFISKITPLRACKVDAAKLRLELPPKEVFNFIRQYFDTQEGKEFLRNEDGGPGVFVYEASKPLNGLSAFGFEAAEMLEEELDLQEGDLLILQARKDEKFSGGSTSLGRLRQSVFSFAVDQGHLPGPDFNVFKPLWIEEFPLFSPSNASEPGQGSHITFSSTHHPFTAPRRSNDINLLTTEPERAIGHHYDLVINGEEIGGGSRRIHHAGMQRFIFQDVLRMPEDKIAEFAPLLTALESGCPPHAGIALGFDRLVAMMASCKFQRKMGMRDVIAFPKNGRGEDPMLQSPGIMTREELKTYHLRHLDEQDDE